MKTINSIIKYFIPKDNSANKGKALDQVAALLATCILTSFLLLLNSMLSLNSNEYFYAAIFLILSILSLLLYRRLQRDNKISPASKAFIFIAGSGILLNFLNGGYYGTAYLWVLIFPLVAYTIPGHIAVKRDTYILFFLIMVVALFTLGLLFEQFSNFEWHFFIKIVLLYLGIYYLTKRIAYAKDKRNNELNELIRQKETDLNDKDQFISKLSHSIRTPLNNITLISSIVDRESLTKEQQELFDTISTSTKSLSKVVNEIVEIEPPEQDFKKPVNIKLDIKNTLTNIIETINNQHKGRITIKLSLSDQIKSLRGDPLKLKQLFNSITDNLNQLNLNEKIEILLSCHIENSYIENASLISFKMDVQNLSSLSNLETGKIDFHTAERITNQYHGEIKTGSKAGIFPLTISLILDNEKESKVPSETNDIESIIRNDNTKKLNEAHVLLVEDNNVNQKIVLLSLKNKVKTIDVANNGKEALDKFGTTKYDIILMDIQMPVMNGIVATKKIRELESSSNTHTPIIAITANALSGDEETCMAAGMNDYISKPFQVEYLVDKMESLLAQD